MSSIRLFHPPRLACFLLCLHIAVGIAAKVQPPLAPVHPESVQVNGQVLTDNWAWLKQREHPDLPAVLDNEERYATQQLKPSQKLAGKIFSEFRKGIPKHYQSHPYLRDGYWYYSKEKSSQAYASHYRRKDDPGAGEEMILDENKLARGSKFFQLGVFALSRDGSKLAYSIDLDGSETYSLWVKDLQSVKSVSTCIDGVSQALWLDGGTTMLLTLENSRYQIDRLCLFNISEHSLTVLYREIDPSFDLSIWESADRTEIFLESSSKNTNQTWHLKVGDGNPTLIPMTGRLLGRLVYPDCLNGVYYAMTNESEPDYEIRFADDPDSSLSEWRIAAPGIDGEPVSTYALFDGALAVLKRRNGFPQIEIYDPVSHNLLRTISRDVPVSLDFWSNTNPSSPSLLYSLENELTPFTIISHNLATGEEDVVFADKPARKIDPSQYEIRLRWVPTTDGVSVPLRLISRRGLDSKISHPLWLYAYGAYGDCEDPYYSNTLFSLLDRGFIYAVANIRGGGEFGKAWYDSGRTNNKTNTFKDFIACMDYLVESGTTDPEHLVIEGGSAGGLLIGAVLNQVPQNICLAIADVPFVDVANTMLDPDLPLTIQEYEEWGDPNTAEGWQDIISYSPYDNVGSVAYPSVLAISGWNDIRVGYWEALKWVQKIRTRTTGNSPIVYLLRKDEGHTGSNDRFQSLRNYAQIMAYAIHLAGDGQ